MAAEKAVEYIQDGMTVGLGTGSTTAYTIKKIGEYVNKNKLTITGIPTSNRAKKLATECKIPLADLDETSEIDLTIDGADEVDSNMNLIKGGGGALTREKMVAYYSKRVIIVIDETKIVKCLGCDFPLPVEIVKYGWRATKKSLENLGCVADLRKIVDEPYITDNGNYILDCDFERIDKPEELDASMHIIPGVVETGLFIDLVDEVIVGSKQGIMSLGRTGAPLSSKG